MWDRILVVASHPDDDVIGCGGAMPVMQAVPGCEVRTIYLSNGVGSRGEAADGEIKQRMDAMEAANDTLGAIGWEVGLFEDQRFDQYPVIELTKWVSRFIEEWRPTTVFTHSAVDINRDHQLTNEAVRTAVRPLPESSVRCLFFFEIEGSTEWGREQFRPGLFIGADIEKKEAALKCYDFEMRHHPHPRSVNSILSHCLARGAECGKPAAEAFEVGRMVFA